MGGKEIIDFRNFRDKFQNPRINHGAHIIMETCSSFKKYYFPIKNTPHGRITGVVSAAMNIGSRPHKFLR